MAWRGWTFRELTLGCSLLLTGCATNLFDGPPSSLSMHLSAPPSIAADLASATLTVYGAGGSCDAMTGAASGAALSGLDGIALTLGQPTTLHVSSGDRTFSVLAYDAQSHLLAQGCSRVSLEPGGHQDVSITLHALPPPGMDAGVDGGTVTPGDTCAMPIPLPVGVPTSATTVGAADDFGSTCGIAGGPDVVFVLDVPTASHATITTVAPGAAVSASLRSTCGSLGSEITCATPDATDTTTIDVGDLPPGMYYVLVDAQNAAMLGAFTITATLGAPGSGPANDTCAGAEVIMPGTPTAPVLPTSGTLVGAAPDAAGTCGAAGPEVFYQVTLAARARVEIQVQTDGFDPLVYVRSMCGDPSTELACDDDEAGTAEFLAIRDLAAGTYFIAVDSPGASGTFTIAVNLLPPPPDDDLCAAATPLLPSTTVMGATDAANDDQAFSCGLAMRPEVYYTFTLPVATHVTLDLADLTGEHALALLGGCGGPELDCQSTVGMTEQIDVPSLPAGTYVVAVEGITPGTFDLTLTEGAAVPPDDACLTAGMLSIGATTTGNLAGAHDDDAGNCGGGGGEDQVYSFFIGSTQHVTISTGAGFPHVVYLRSVCGDLATEIACAVSASGVATIDLGALPGGSYYVWFDRIGTGDGTNLYSLRVDAAPPLLPPPNDACATAAALVPGTVSGTLLNAADDTASLSCGGAGGADVFYTFTIAQPKRVRATVTATGTPFDPVLSLRSTCAAGSEIGCANGSAGTTEQLDILTLAPGTYTLVVDSASAAGGPFSLLWEVLDPPPANDTCAAPTTLPPGTLAGQTIAGAADDELGSGACIALGATDVIYTFTTAADQHAQITVSSPGFNAAIYLRTDCPTNGADIACANAGATSETIDRPFLPAGTYYVIVDKVSGAGTAFDITLTLTPPVIPGDSCASPLVLAGTGGSDTNTLIGKSNDTTGTCGGAGADAAYQFTISGARHVTVTADSSGTFDYALYLRASPCATGVQQACVVSAGGAGTVDILNLPAGTYYVFLDALAGAGGPYTIQLTASSAVPPPSNDTCAAPGALPSGPGQTLFGANDDYQGSCNPVGGVEDVYGFTLASRSQVTVTGSAAGDVAVYLGSSCGVTASELGCANATSSGLESLTVPDLPAGSYFVYVEGVNGYAGSFTPTITITPPPANDSCAGAIALSSGTTLTGQTLAVADDSASGSCAGAGLTRDVFYTFTLASRSVVDVNVTNTSVNTTVSLEGTCGGAEVACSATSSPGEAAHFVDLGAGTYTVLVDGPPGGGAGTFDITYTATAVPDNNSCVAPAVATVGTTTSGTLVAATNEYAGTCGGGAGADVVYSFSLASPARVRTTVTRTSGTFDPVVYLRSACASAGSELGGGCSNASSGAIEIDDLDTVPAGSYVVVVDSAGGVPGTFDLLVEALPIPPANDRCPTPPSASLIEGVISHGDTFGARDDTTASCGTGGIEVFYSFTLSAESRVVLNLTNSVPLQALYVQGTCGVAGTQLACASTATPETLDLLDLPAGTYTAVVEAEGSPGGPFDLVYNTFAPVRNDTCATAIDLGSGAPPTTRTGDSSIGALDQESGTCAGGPTPDVFYTYTLASARHVNLQVTSTYDAAVSLRTTCNNSGTETTCQNAVVGPGTEVIDIRTQPAGTYSVLVDGAGNSSGTANLTFTTSAPPPPGDSCAEVVPIATNVTTTGQSLSASYADDSTGTCGGAGIDRVYTFTIASNEHVNIVTHSTTLVHRLYLRATSCTTGGEVACAASVLSGGLQTATIDVPNLAGGTYYIFVDAQNPGDTGTFDITPTVTAPSGAPSNDTCAMADTLIAGVSTGGTTVAALDDTATCVAGAHPDVFYRIHLTANQQVTVTATPSAAVDVGMQLRAADCTTPIACVNAAGTGGSEQIVQDNLAGPADYYLVVEQAGGTAGTFNVAYTIAPPVVRPANDACAGAIAIATGPPGRVGDNVTNALNDAAGTCGGASGDDVVYSFTIPPGPNKQAKITVNNASSFDPVIHLHGGSCGGAELGCAQNQMGPQEILDLPNLPPGTYFVWVDELIGVTSGTFDIEVDLLTAVPPPSNDVCAAPVALVSGTPVTGDTTGATDDYNLTCLAFDSRDTVYSLTVPAGGKAVLVTVTPTTPTWDLATALRTGANCATGDGVTPAADLSCQVEVFSQASPRYINQKNLAAGSYDVIVDGDTGGYGTYSVRYDAAAVDPNFGYWRLDSTSTYTSIAGAAGATSWPIPLGNPAGVDWNESMTLPFSFDYFGTARTTINVSGNMYIDLDGATYTGDTSRLSSCPLASTNPNDIIAAFWDSGYSDNLAPVSQLWTRTEGTAPNRRFVIEWKDQGQLAKQGGSYWIINDRVNQQAILYENGDIELRYGPRTAPTLSKNCGSQQLGCDATLGIEGQVAGSTQVYGDQCNASTVTDGKVVYYVHPR